MTLGHWIAISLLSFPPIAAGLAAWSQQPERSDAPVELTRMPQIPAPMTGREVVTLSQPVTVIELEPLMIRGRLRHPTSQAVDIMTHCRWHDIEEGIKVCQ